MRITRVFVICSVLGLGMMPSQACIAAPQDAPRDGDGKTFNVGYRVLDFKFKTGGQEKALTVAVWYPTDAQPKEHTYGGPTRGKVAVDAEPLAQGGAYPLLVFSHGYAGGGTGHVFLAEPLAARGWIVAAPDHNDKDSAVRIRTGQQKDLDRQGFLRHALEITQSGPDGRDAYMYRLDEMKVVLDKMVESEVFGKLIDKEKIAVGGHSFGGFTALGLCGTIEARRDERIKAALLFSTGAGCYLFRENELAAVKVPTMLYLGEREKSEKRGSRTMAELADAAFRSLPPPKYFLEVKGANHFSFNNRLADTRGARSLSGTDEQFDVIRRYSIAFLEKHVAGRHEAGKVLEKQDPMLTRYEREPR